MLEIIIKGLCIAFFGLLSWLTINVFSIIAFDKDTGQLCHLLWKKINAKNDAYKDFVRTTESYGRVVELPFSVVQPLLRDDSPTIVVAQSDRLAIKDENCRNNNIYIKLSKQDYNEYIKFLEQKEANKEQLKKTEDTLAVTQLINKELKRINDAAMTSVAKEVENINNIAEICEYLNLEEAPPKVDALTSKIDTVTTYVLNDGMEWELKTVTVRPEKFDWELVNDIFRGETAIVINDITEYFQFRESGLTDIVRCDTLNTIGYPRVAYYSRVTDQWFIGPYGTHIFNATVNITQLFKCCPDFVTIFNKKIQDTGVRYD